MTSPAGTPSRAASPWSAHGFGSSKDSPPPSCWPGSSPARHRHPGTGPPRSRGQPGGRGRSEHPPLPGRPGPGRGPALELAPGARVVYFSSSFGAYLNLIYLSTRPHRGTRSFLRSAAVEMPLLFHSPHAGAGGGAGAAGLPHAGPGLRPPSEADPCLPGGSGCPRPLFNCTAPGRSGSV